MIWSKFIPSHNIREISINTNFICLKQIKLLILRDKIYFNLTSFHIIIIFINPHFPCNSLQIYKRNLCRHSSSLSSRDGNGLDLIQDPCDPNPIGSDLDRFKMDLDRIWISIYGSKTDLEQIWIYLNI